MVDKITVYCDFRHYRHQCRILFGTEIVCAEYAVYGTALF